MLNSELNYCHVSEVFSHQNRPGVGSFGMESRSKGVSRMNKQDDWELIPSNIGFNMTNIEKTKLNGHSRDCIDAVI